MKQKQDLAAATAMVEESVSGMKETGAGGFWKRVPRLGRPEENKKARPQAGRKRLFCC